MSYATDGVCHNAEPGTYGHECGKPAVWIGVTSSGFRSGYCDACKREGWEALQCIRWEPVPSHANSPLTRSAAAALPLLIEAHGLLHGLAAPQAAKLAERIGALLEATIDLAGDVQAYGNKWCGGDIGKLAGRLQAATKEYDRI